jgi:hypothetical protein
MELSSIIAITISILLFLITYFGLFLKIKEDVQMLKAKNEIFWSVIQPHLATIIHSPEHIERDNLVDKMGKVSTEIITHLNGNLNLTELRTLEAMLYSELKDGDKAKIIGAALLLIRVKQLIYDKEH